MTHNRNILKTTIILLLLVLTGGCALSPQVKNPPVYQPSQPWMDKDTSIRVEKAKLRKKFSKGNQIFNWLSNSTYVKKRSGYICIITADTDLKKLREDLNNQFPLEADRFVNGLEEIFYKEYVRTKIFEAIKDIPLNRNTGILISFEVGSQGNLMDISVAPFTKNVSPEQLRDIDAVLVKMTLLPLPDSGSEYFKGYLTRKMLGDVLENGTRIFDWLLANKFIKNELDEQFKALPLTEELKKKLSTAYPMDAWQIQLILEGARNPKYNIKILFK